MYEAEREMETNQPSPQGKLTVYLTHYYFVLLTILGTYVYPPAAVGAGSQTVSEPQLTFPCLDLSKMSKEEETQLHQRLYNESVTMMDRFQYLFSATIESLKQRKVPVKELLCHLVGLGSLPPTYDDLNLPLFRQQFPELKKSKTIDEAMLEIGNYCSFFNFRVIEHIIAKLGTRQDKENLSKYREEFNKYAERHVFECPSEVGIVSDNLANIFVTRTDLSTFFFSPPRHLSSLQRTESSSVSCGRGQALTDLRV